jgi:hypothetical protein
MSADAGAKIFKTKCVVWAGARARRGCRGRETGEPGDLHHSPDDHTDTLPPPIFARRRDKSCVPDARTNNDAPLPSLSCPPFPRRCAQCHTVGKVRLRGRAPFLRHHNRPPRPFPPALTRATACPHVPSSHTLQGEGHKQGPNLNGLFGRVAGTAADYSYSAANKSSGA